MKPSRHPWQVFSVASMQSRWSGRWDAWLHPQESVRADEFRDSSRRQAWIFGRIAARQLILTHLSTCSISPRQIQIISKGAALKGCSPRVLIDGVVQPWSVTLAHSKTWVAVAIATTVRPIGIDVVDLEDV